MTHWSSLPSMQPSNFLADPFTVYANVSLNKFIKYNCEILLGIQVVCIRSDGTHVNTTNNGDVAVVVSGKDPVDFMAFTDSTLTTYKFDVVATFIILYAKI